MGKYTELNIELAVKVTDNVLHVLEFMTGQSEDKNFEIPTHPLFKSPRWEYMLCCESVYFSHTAHSSIDDPCFGEDDADDSHKNRVLNVRCDLKNYEDEIENFLDWIRHYTRTRGFIGYMRYEEDADPTLIYFTQDSVEYYPVRRKQV